MRIINKRLVSIGIAALLATSAVGLNSQTTLAADPQNIIHDTYHYYRYKNGTDKGYKAPGYYDENSHYHPYDKSDPYGLKANHLDDNQNNQQSSEQNNSNTTGSTNSNSSNNTNNDNTQSNTATNNADQDTTSQSQSAPSQNTQNSGSSSNNDSNNANPVNTPEESSNSQNKASTSSAKSKKHSVKKSNSKTKNKKSKVASQASHKFHFSLLVWNVLGIGVIAAGIFGIFKFIKSHR